MTVDCCCLLLAVVWLTKVVTKKMDFRARIVLFRKLSKEDQKKHGEKIGVLVNFEGDINNKADAEALFRGDSVEKMDKRLIYDETVRKSIIESILSSSLIYHFHVGCFSNSKYEKFWYLLHQSGNSFHCVCLKIVDNDVFIDYDKNNTGRNIFVTKNTMNPLRTEIPEDAPPAPADDSSIPCFDLI